MTAASGLTYTAVGATQSSDLLRRPPTGFRPMVRAVMIGRGEACFGRASAATMRFGIQRRAGLTVTRAPGAGRRRVGSAGRRRRGFGYGTLRGHPECGEAAFIVEWRADDSVWLEIRTFSRPAYPVLWLGYPLLRLIQETYTRRYERALLALVE